MLWLTCLGISSCPRPSLTNAVGRLWSALYCTIHSGLISVIYFEFATRNTSKSCEGGQFSSISFCRAFVYRRPIEYVLLVCTRSFTYRTDVEVDDKDMQHTLGFNLEKEISTRCTGKRLSMMPASLHKAASFATTILPVFRRSPNRQYFMNVCMEMAEANNNGVAIISFWVGLNGLEIPVLPLHRDVTCFC